MFKKQQYKLGTLLICLSLSACSNEEATVDRDFVRSVQMLTVDLLATKTHSFPGKVEASRQANLSFRVPGKIATYHVHSGQQVKAGDKLIELVPTDYEILVAAKQANYQLSNVQHQRSEALIGDSLISQDEFDKSSTALKVAENELAQAKTDLSYTSIYAPYDGIIASTYLKAHEYAQALQPVMSLQSENSIDVAIEVPERLIGAIQRSSETRKLPVANFAVKPEQQYQLTIKEVETAADPDSGSFTVTLTMPQPDDLTLYPGMAATVHVELVVQVNNLVQQIPPSALMVDGGKSFVWRVNTNNQLSYTEINVDANGALVSGLNDGDKIVIAGVTELSDGQTVREWVKERGL